MRLTAIVLAVVLTVVQMPGAVRGDRAEYIGGTASLKEGSQGVLNLTNSAEMVFTSGKSTFKVPYASVTSLEFGQKIGRRVGATVALGVTTLGIGALPVLFSKKKRHYLTVGYRADGANQAAIFELAKDTVRKTLATLEARTGKQVERDDTADLDKPKETTERAAAAAPASASAVQQTAVIVQPAAATAQIQPVASASQPPMTNADVAKMVQAGLSHDIVLAAIRNCEPHFNLMPNDMDALLRVGVTSQMIKAMAARQH